MTASLIRFFPLRCVAVFGSAIVISVAPFPRVSRSSASVMCRATDLDVVRRPSPDQQKNLPFWEAGRTQGSRFLLTALTTDLHATTMRSLPGAQ